MSSHASNGYYFSFSPTIKISNNTYLSSSSTNAPFYIYISPYVTRDIKITVEAGNQSNIRPYIIYYEPASNTSAVNITVEAHYINRFFYGGVYAPKSEVTINVSNYTGFKIDGAILAKKVSTINGSAEVTNNYNVFGN